MRPLLTLLFALALPGVAAANSLTLMWDPSAGPNATGYVVYVGTQSGSYTKQYDVGNSTSFTFFDGSPGSLYYFAVAAYAAGPLLGAKSSEVAGYSNAPPVLLNPGAQSGTVGVSVTLQLAGSDPYGDPVSYAASGLPPGLGLTQSTGFISGTPSTAGSYQVTAAVSDGVLSDQQAFTWTVAAQTVVTAADPSLTVTHPSSDTRFDVNTTSITLGGSASHAAGIASVAWSTGGSSGLAAGTQSWMATVPLKNGSNTIALTATSKAGTVSSTVVTVFYRKGK